MTSQYDYAQYLREIVIDSWKGGDKGERVYRQYSYDYSCGKFMSTLLQLALRRAPALETFRFDCSALTRSLKLTGHADGTFGWS